MTKGIALNKVSIHDLFGQTPYYHSLECSILPGGSQEFYNCLPVLPIACMFPSDTEVKNDFIHKFLIGIQIMSFDISESQTSRNLNHPESSLLKKREI
jgi:hypothetical protein